MRILSMSGKCCGLGSSSERRGISASLRTFLHAFLFAALCCYHASLRYHFSKCCYSPTSSWCVSATTIRGHLVLGRKHNPGLQPHAFSSGKLGLNRGGCPGPRSAH